MVHVWLQIVVQQALDASRVVEGGGNSRSGGVLKGGETDFPAFRHEGIVVTFSQNQMMMKSRDGAVVKCAEFEAGDSGDVCRL